MTAGGQPVSGQDINMAARATRKALDVVLAEQGTSFPPLAMLNTLMSRGGSVDRDALIAQLARVLATAVFVHRMAGLRGSGANCVHCGES